MAARAQSGTALEENLSDIKKKTAARKSRYSLLLSLKPCRVTVTPRESLCHFTVTWFKLKFIFGLWRAGLPGGEIPNTP